MWQAVNRLLSECLGPAEIRERTELPGGDIHEAWRLSYGEKEVFVKCNTREMLPIFTAESDQLSLLARSKTVQVVTNGAIVIHTQRLKSDPGGNLLS